jgi:predicted nuclease of predicted toxin-antitoxin system
MKLLIDMNLSPLWVEFFERNGLYAVHWSRIGDPGATDSTIMEWARSDGYVVFTHDLDFGTILAVTQAGCPSVIQVRTQEVLPEYIGNLVLAGIAQFRDMLEQGALITLNESTARARILPLTR